MALEIVGADGKPIVLRAVNYVIACERSDPESWLLEHMVDERLRVVSEPERGVHHHRLAALAGRLRAERWPMTLVMFTRCPYFLDTANIETDQVIVLIEDKPYEIDRERLKRFTDGVTLGEIWHNEGERGLIRQRPLGGALEHV